MGSTKSLSLLVIAGAAWLYAFPAAAEEENEKRRENHTSRSAAPGKVPARTPQAGGNSAGEPASPRAPENHGNSDSDHHSLGESILFDLLFDSRTDSDNAQYSSLRPNQHHTSFNDLHIETGQDWFVSYVGLGVGRSVAYYPSNSNAHLAWKGFFGGRTKNFGLDFGLNGLSTISTTVNSQPVSVSTDAFSLSVVGYLPLAKNADLYLKYGGVLWSVSTNSNANANLPVTNGTSRVLGAGFEIRDSKGDYFLRLEKEMFREVYQSKFYTFVGLSLGFYD